MINSVTSVATPSGFVPEPMRIGQIIDRAFRLLVPFIRALFVPLLLVILAGTGIQVGDILPTLTERAIAKVGCGLTMMVLAFYLMFAMPLTAASLWRGEQVPPGLVRERVTFRFALRFIGLITRVGLMTILLLLLLIIPGLIYMLNRVLATYIYLLEDVTATEALIRSKKLMSQGKWYSFKSPWWRLSCFFILQMVIAMTGGFFQGFAAGIMRYPDQISLLVKVAMTVITLLSVTFTHCLSGLMILCYVGFYYDLRARYEGSDLLQTLKSGS